MRIRTFLFLSTGPVKRVFFSVPYFEGHVVHVSYFQDFQAESFDLGSLKQVEVMDRCKFTTVWEIQHQA